MTEALDPLAMEYRRMCAINVAEHSLNAFVVAVEAEQRGEQDDDTMKVLANYLAHVTQGELVDAYLVLMELIVTKQWTLENLRRDCPCEECVDNRVRNGGNA